VHRVIEQGVVLLRAFAGEELERFTDRAPGQANSYFCGYAKLLALRKDTEAVLGTKFNQKNFSDLTLAQGLLPPDLMRQSSVRRFCRFGEAAGWAGVSAADCSCLDNYFSGSQTTTR
jgi:hypothetical protein